MTTESKPHQSIIIQYANKLAQISSFPGLVYPIPLDSWKRPYTFEKVAGFDCLKLGILTAAESAVINMMRVKLSSGIQTQRLNVYTVYLRIAEALQVEGDQDLNVFLSDASALSERIEELGLTDDIAVGWSQEITLAANSVNIQMLHNEVREHIVTFFCAMRIIESWDYTDTLQLSQTEKEDIYQFMLREEDAPTEIVSKSDETVKKS